jgi:hypothetical protein
MNGNGPAWAIQPQRNELRLDLLLRKRGARNAVAAWRSITEAQ